MSLIQQALEKTRKKQEEHAASEAVKRKQLYDEKFFGKDFEKKLYDAQKNQLPYERQKKLPFLAIVIIPAIAAAAIILFLLPQNKSQFSGGTNSTPVLQLSTGTIYRLTGITDLRERKIAVLNGHLSSVGDKVGSEAVVKEINDGFVILDVHGSEVRLTL